MLNDDAGRLSTGAQPDSVASVQGHPELASTRPRPLTRARDGLDRFVLRPLAGLALLSMMVAIAANALARGFFDVAFGWVVPFVTGLAMPAVAFIGLPILTLARGHVRMEAVADRVGPRIRMGFRVIAWAVGALSLVVVGYANMVSAYERSSDADPLAFSIPAPLQYGMVAGACLVTVLILAGFLTSPRRNTDDEYGADQESLSEDGDNTDDALSTGRRAQ